MRTIKVRIGPLFVAAGLLMPSGASASELAAADFERLHKEIRPRPGEAPWSEIAWTYDLNAALVQAAREGKPLCVWRMAGDPTGSC